MEADDDAAVLRFAAPSGPRQRSPLPGPLWRELVGQVLRAERIENGWTLRQVSARAGVSPQYLSEVERGRKDASSEMLESICGALHLRLVDLLSSSASILQKSALRSAAIHSPAAHPVGRPTGVTSMAA